MLLHELPYSVVEVEGERIGRTNRVAAGDPGSADSQDALDRGTARLGDFRASATGLNEVLSIQQGSLYPALHRLERRGWIKARWGTSENNRRAKYYELTRNGEKQLERETETWRKLTVAVAQVLEGA